MKTLDDDIRDVFAALDGTTPEGYFDTLAARIDERLEVEAMGPEMIAGMSSNANDMPPVVPVPSGTPATQGTEKAREENTGLHDIKEMAKVRQAKISKRHSTQSDAEESLLNSASSSSLSAIVLPTPGKGKDNYQTAATATAVPGSAGVSGSAMSAASASADVSDRSGMPVWIYGAVIVAAAAAGVIFYLTRAGGESGEEIAAADISAAAAAQSDTALAAGSTGAPQTAGPTAVAIQEAPAPAVVDGDHDGNLESEDGTAGADTPQLAVTDPASVGEKSTDEAVVVAARTVNKRSAKTDKSKSLGRGSSAKGSGASSKSKKPSATKKPAKPKASKKADGSKRSLDDLLNEAAGGAKSNRDLDPAEKTGPVKPSKTALTRADIKAGMRKVAGRVGRCHEKFKVSGNVMIKVSISPSGTVNKAAATGKFKNTETGQCVANAVKKAKFPAWTGSRQSFSYPFLLSQ